MKIRSGFVSNSSSSSFCLFGIAVDSCDFSLLAEKLGIHYNKDHEYMYEYADIFEEALREKGLDGEFDGECFEYGYIGFSIHRMKDDETKKEFMDRASSKVNELLDRKASWYIGEVYS